MRDRLIELLNNIGMIHEREAETVAEYLLDHGVIVKTTEGAEVADDVYKVVERRILRKKLFEEHQRMMLTDKILTAVPGCEKNWAEDIAKYLFARGLNLPPCEVKNNMTGCMCAECMFAKPLKDNHKKEIAICMCRESEYFLHELDFESDNCDFGVVDDEEEGESDV